MPKALGSVPSTTKMNKQIDNTKLSSRNGLCRRQQYVIFGISGTRESSETNDSKPGVVALLCSPIYPGAQTREDCSSLGVQNQPE